MSVLSDVRLLEKIYDHEIKIDPFIYSNIQPSSIDLILDNKIKVPQSDKCITAIDENMEQYFEEKILNDYILKPGDFILGQIKETIGLSNKLTGQIHNRNSLIRQGINVGLSSYINPGYQGQLTIAIQNVGKFSVEIYPGMRICQLVVQDVEPDSETDYSKRNDAKYGGESGVSVSKLYMDTEVSEYLNEFNKASSKEINKDEFIKFLDDRIRRLSSNTLESLTEEERKKIGLL